VKSHTKNESEETSVSLKVPKEAFNFTDLDTVVELKESEGKARLEMVVYSGKVIDHAWWGKLAIDGNGGSFKKRKYPVLFEHDTSKQIGFTHKPKVEEGGKVILDSDKTFILETEEAKNFVLAAKDGFPFEASISIKPTRIENLEKDQSGSVNGYKVSGPFSIIREWEFREASVCTFGADRNTSSSVFSEAQMEEITCNFTNRIYTNVGGTSAIPDFPPSINYYKYIIPKEVKKDMKTLAELKEEYKELCEDLKLEVKTECMLENEKEVNELKAKLEDSEKINASLKAEKEAISERLIILEKKDSIRTEKELKDQVDDVFTKHLSESSIPNRYWDKVKACVNSNTYIKDLCLDVKSFTDAIVSEIKDWEDKGVTTEILGSGKTKRDLSDQGGKDFDASSIADNLLKLAGQKIN